MAMAARWALSLLSLPVVVAAPTEDCTSSGSCRGDDDLAMLQFAQVGREHPPLYPNGKTFALRSQPFFSDESGARGIVRSSLQQGKIVIDEDGELNTYYFPGATTTDRHMTVEYRPPYRFYLMKEPTTDYGDASKFYKPYLPGKTLTVDIDFGASGPSCGCNLNFYLVDMPVRLEGKDQDHYCDAQCFPGMGCCAEFDLNEGNNKVQQITNHACTHNYDGHPGWACHKWGEPEVKTQRSDFGPGGDHTIDSTKPFTFSQRFDVDINGRDLILTTRMIQEGREVSLTMGPGNEQLNAMLRVLDKRMAFVTGYWFAGDMNWMDGEQCGGGEEHCNMNPARISNWRLYTNGPVPAPPPPMPTPAPTPPPAPVGSKCCWTGCTSCQDDPTNWCNQGGEHRCTGPCEGNWC